MIASGENLDHSSVVQMNTANHRLAYLTGR